MMACLNESSACPGPYSNSHRKAVRETTSFALYLRHFHKRARSRTRELSIVQLCNSQYPGARSAMFAFATSYRAE
ncbi:hypothetical protein PUN28_003532 [Cardiocondyla obscurior]|uniref:Uncharacterized protein n=1 Tax=Cardiocondyla obscurior TaxID=286306 RepID=A0AAW2GKV3_9HYME